MVSRYLKLRKGASHLLLGPRQTGKTNFVKNQFTEAWTINLLLTSEYLRYSKDPSLFRKEALFRFKNKKNLHVVFIDEIQKIPQLLDEVHSLIEEFSNTQFILTGSSARKLKKNSANLLAGRALSRRMYPFIWPEIYNHPNTSSFEDILKYGSLPCLFNKEENFKQEILRTYIDTYLKEEIQMEGLSRSLPQFSHFLDVAAQSFTETINYSNIGRACGQSPKTTQNYFEILEDTLIGFKLLSWSESKRKQLASHPKFYFFDNGVTTALLSRLIDPIDAPLKGRLFEQWIINEVRARVDYDQRDIQLFNWRTLQGNTEVDLFAARGKKPLFAAEIKSFDKPHNEHFKGLKAIQEEYPNLPLYLICTANEPYQMDSITIIPWEKFLLEELPRY